MSDKKPGSMDEFLKMSQSKRAQDDKEKKKKEKDKDKGKPKEPKVPASKKPASKQPLEPAESSAQPSSKDIFALLEETETEAVTKIKTQILDVVQSLVQAYGEIPINRIAKRIPGEAEERVVSVLEDLIIAGAIKARLSTDKIIPIEGTNKISVEKGAAKTKLTAAPAMAEESIKAEPPKLAGRSKSGPPEPPKLAGRSKSGPPEPPKLVAPSLEAPPSINVPQAQKGSRAKPFPTPPAAPRVPSIPSIAEPPSLSLSGDMEQAPSAEESEIPDFPNPEPLDEEIQAPEPIQRPAPVAPAVPKMPAMKPGLKPMKMPAPKAPAQPAPAMQKPMAPKVPAMAPKVPAMAPKVPAMVKPLAQKAPAVAKPAVPKVPAVPPMVPTPPSAPSMKPAGVMKPVKAAKTPAASAVPFAPQGPRVVKPAPAKPVSKEEQAAMFEQKVNQMLQDRPEELSLIYKLFENPKLALLGFDEDWIAGALGTTAEHAVELIKYLRGLNIVKLGPSGLNFVINTGL